MRVLAVALAKGGVAKRIANDHVRGKSMTKEDEILNELRRLRQAEEERLALERQRVRDEEQRAHQRESEARQICHGGRAHPYDGLVPLGQHSWDIMSSGKRRCQRCGLIN